MISNYYWHQCYLSSPHSSVADTKRFVSDPGPTFQAIMDTDPVTEPFWTQPKFKEK